MPPIHRPTHRAPPTTSRLTTLSHGCLRPHQPSPRQCIGAPEDNLAIPILPPELLVAHRTADDAAVYQPQRGATTSRRWCDATTDFFMPIVDDPFDFGRIAAANALSDVCHGRHADHGAGAGGHADQRAVAGHHRPYPG